jgi:hypothetical protein
MQEVLDRSGLKPILARNLPALSARSRMNATTIVVGDSHEIEEAVKVWKDRPKVSIGTTLPDFDFSIPSTAEFGFLTDTSAPNGTKPFVVGDVHNCHRTLSKLLEKLDITPGEPQATDPLLVFVGDLVDKGGTDPLDPLRTLELVHRLTVNGQAVVVRGNHEQMLLRRTLGTSPEAPSSQRSVDAVKSSTSAATLLRWLGTLPLAFRLPSIEGTEMTVAHATSTSFAFAEGFKARKHAEQSCLFGRPTSSPLPGVSIHGHWEVDEVSCTADRNRLVVNVDTGACLGRKLSALDASVLPSVEHVASISVPTELLDLSV